MAMRNIKLTVEYKGTAYAGWQIQAGQATVQGEIVEAIRRTTGKKVSVHGAGRTDAGVHALGQVASFRIDHHVEPGRYKDALNYYLPDDMRVREAVEVPLEFHARKGAKGKRYRYVIAGERSALWREYRWEIEGRGGDLRQMWTSAAHAPGTSAAHGRDDQSGFSVRLRRTPEPDLREPEQHEERQDHKGPDLQKPDLRGENEMAPGPGSGPGQAFRRGDIVESFAVPSGRKRPDLRFELLQQAADIILGEHDFAAFCVTASRKEDNRCRIDHARWYRIGPLLVFEIRGNRFLHNMVRSLVGAMVNLAGETRDRHPDNLTLDRFADIIHAPKQQRIVFTAPARGLYLVSVQY